MHPRVLCRVLGYNGDIDDNGRPSGLGFQHSTLIGYTRRQVVGLKYPAVIADANDSVDGVVVSGLTAEDMTLLDAFEGDEYDRRSVTIGGEDCMVYYWIAGADRLANKSWDTSFLEDEAQVQNWLEAEGV
ncbi:hypothetical protein BABINDRAFT_158855 [Babjeviella inositovora NRRL Y-12698]|uniref:Putative gamma-glutamylcyclotransferase n=1 Tax=Babjeviella inositovora NRRL Y-12698 TaxID=984486 RepID=A0A1E3QWY4_9ASCO|nr:uncharacterized protein BABINDRAFT_158855 [Babjeviella inositovora NRRL Y-12698]ODQ82209.1 hypothetical protein BABINDRAFT_158855 [Babjeviella inositovora NRRL Y-12698]